VHEQRPIWRREPLWLIAVGLLWLELGTGHGAVSRVLGSIPGLLLLGAGVSSWLWPGDPRERHFGAAGALLGIVIALGFAWSWLGFWGALGLAAASLFAGGAVGYLALRVEEPPEDVPDPGRAVRTALEVALDEAILAQMTLTAPARALKFDGERVVGEVHEALAMYRERGWLEKPESYHATPPPLGDADVSLAPARVRGRAFEKLRFESGYEPHDGEPGRDRYLSYVPPRTAHAWVMRGKPENPWLVCIHGYQMGIPLVDFGAFRPEWLHDRLGLNLILPVLPLHGPRKIRRMSGDGMLAGDLLDTVHALAQTAWDLRRVMSWVRAQGATRIGVFGLSLGGYSTALLSSFDADLACAIPGIPATDFARLSWRHGPPDSLRVAEELGVGLGETIDLKRVVSPLVLEPKVPFERRYIFGGSADQLVPPDQVRDLWRHWGEPKILWYPGAHVTFGAHPPVRRFIDDAFRESGLVS